MEYKNYTLMVDTDSCGEEGLQYIDWLISNGANVSDGMENSGTDDNGKDLSNEDLNKIWETYCNA